MPDFDTQHLIGWFHFVGLVVAGGSIPVCIIVSRFEDSNDDVKGLSAAIWERFTVWAMRFALICGIFLLVIHFQNSGAENVKMDFQLSGPIGLVLLWFFKKKLKSRMNTRWRIRIEYLEKLAAKGAFIAGLCGVSLYFYIFFFHLKDDSFAPPHLMLKLGLGMLIFVICENTAKSLEKGNRGLAMMTMVVFVVASFIAINHS